MSGIDKFSKWICKTIYRSTHAKKYHHNKNLWPFFKVDRYASGQLGDVYFKRHRITNIDLHICEKTKPLVIMATGPSVNQINRRFFDDSFDYLGVNGAFSMRNVHFEWYVIIDRDFVRERLSLVKEIVAREELVLFCTYNSLDSIFSNIPFKDVRCQIKIFETASSSLINRFLLSRCPINNSNDHYHWHQNFGFSDKIEEVLFDYGTVTYPALQIACLLGYKQIYIVGLDMNNFNTPRFYETSQDKLGTRLNLDFDNINHSFLAAQDYCQSHNIQVVNLSPESAIDAFPKMRWDNLHITA